MARFQWVIRIFTALILHVMGYKSGVLSLVELFGDIEKLITSHIKKYMKTLDCWMLCWMLNHRPFSYCCCCNCWIFSAPPSSFVGPSEPGSRGHRSVQSFNDQLILSHLGNTYYSPLDFISTYGPVSSRYWAHWLAVPVTFSQWVDDL